MSHQKYIHNRYNSSSKTQTSIQVGLFAKKSFQTKYTWLQRCVDKPKLLTQSCAELTFAFRAKHSRTSCAVISHKKSVIIKPFSNNCSTWHWQSSRNNMQKQWRNFKFWAPPQGNQLGPPLPCPDDPAYHCNLPPQHQHFSRKAPTRTFHNKVGIHV